MHWPNSKPETHIPPTGTVHPHPGAPRCVAGRDGNSSAEFVQWDGVEGCAAEGHLHCRTRWLSFGRKCQRCVSAVGAAPAAGLEGGTHGDLQSLLCVTETRCNTTLTDLGLECPSRRWRGEPRRHLPSRTALAILDESGKQTELQEHSKLHGHGHRTSASGGGLGVESPCGLGLSWTRLVAPAVRFCPLARCCQIVTQSRLAGAGGVPQYTAAASVAFQSACTRSLGSGCAAHANACRPALAANPPRAPHVIQLCCLSAGTVTRTRTQECHRIQTAFISHPPKFCWLDVSPE